MVKKYIVRTDGHYGKLLAVDEKTRKYIRENDKQVKIFIDLSDLEKILLEKDMIHLLTKIKDGDDENE